MKHPLPLVFLLLAILPPLAHAHLPGQSYVYVRVYDHVLEVRVEITTDHLNRALDLGLSREVDAARADVGRHLGRILAYVGEHLHLGSEQGPLALRFASYDLLPMSLGTFVLLRYETPPLAAPPRRLDATFTVGFDEAPSHRNFLLIEYNWKTGTFNNESQAALVFTPASRHQTLDLSSASVLRGFMGIFQLGTWHIWIGLDHILFLLALALPSVLYREGNTWRPVPGFKPALVNITVLVTLFTLAHSITLSLASLGVVRLSPRVVEPVIAVSIAAAALHNLYPRLVRWERGIAFAFGLFHGFGFASVLSEFGMEPRYVVHALLGFNLGVEFGQLVILTVVFPVLYLLRTRPFYRSVILKYGSMMLISMALFWFVERAFDVPLSRYGRRAFRLASRLLM